MKPKHRTHARASLELQGFLEPWRQGEFKAPLPCKLCDLSGGGCAVTVGKELWKETLVRLHLDLPGVGPVFLGRVKHCMEIESDQGAQYYVGIDFELDELERSRLIRHVYTQRGKERPL